MAKQNISPNRITKANKKFLYSRIINGDLGRIPLVAKLNMKIGFPAICRWDEYFKIMGNRTKAAMLDDR